MSHSEKKDQLLSRREVLKTLMATGGTVTLSTLPNKWEKPVIRVGTLPVFAQVSPIATTISQLSVSSSQGICDPGGGQPGTLFSVSFNYTDPSGSIIAGQTRVRAIFEFLPSGITNSDEITLSPVNITGNEFNGIILIPTCIGFASATSVNLTISVVNASDLESNSETINIINIGTTEPQEIDAKPRGVIIAP